MKSKVQSWPRARSESSHFLKGLIGEGGLKG